MNAFFKAAQTARHVLVDFYDDLFAGFANGSQMRSVRTKVEIAVLVHRCDLNHNNIRRANALSIPTRQLGIAQRGIERDAVVNHVALNAAHVPRVPREMLVCVRNLCDGKRLHQDAAADVDVYQLVCTSGQCLVQFNRRAGAPAVIYPVAALDDLCCLCGSCQFTVI